MLKNLIMLIAFGGAQLNRDKILGVVQGFEQQISRQSKGPKIFNLPFLQQFNKNYDVINFSCWQRFNSE